MGFSWIPIHKTIHVFLENFPVLREGLLGFDYVSNSNIPT